VCTVLTVLSNPFKFDQMSVPSHSIVDSGTDLLWTQLQDEVRRLKWTSDDNLMLSLVPSLTSTRCVFARKDEDGSFLGCVAWNEYDEMAFIGMYICVPEMRGSGIGSRMWKRAMERIRATGKVIGLRGAPAMAPKYAANDTPLEISRLRLNILTCDEMRATCLRINMVASGSIKMKSTLTPAQIEELLAFDLQMTGRDRKDLLVPFLASPSFECAVLLNEDGKIVAWAGITSTGLEKEHLFKLGPVYASSLSQFATLTEALIPFCEKKSSESKIVVHIVNGTVGERELEPLLKNPQNIEWVTLFNDKINWTRRESCYVPHNCSSHFDG
ncbi:hypothetical protein PENTCL1PPCAC_14933, partial [Pristionchus entomophagus]